MFVDLNHTAFCKLKLMEVTSLQQTILIIDTRCIMQQKVGIVMQSFTDNFTPKNGSGSVFYFPTANTINNTITSKEI